jgi:competence protein ComEA
MKRFSRSQAVVVLLGALGILSFSLWRYGRSVQQRVEPSHQYPIAAVVQVSGQVRAPGIYSFDLPITVNELVARAGGLPPSLKPAYHWTQLQVEHGQRVHVMSGSNSVAQVRLSWMGASSLLALGVLLDVNRASVEDLALVPGVNRRLAEHIVAHRQQKGEFTRLEELDDVKGIGPATLERIRPYLKVSGKR